MAAKQHVPVPITQADLEQSSSNVKDQIVSVAAGILPPVEVSPPGYAIRVTWTPVYGATRAEITSAVARIGSASVHQALGDLTIRKSGKAYEITVPDGKRIASLTLFGMRKSGESVDITSQGSLPSVPEGHRLVVATREGGSVGAPLFAVPSVGKRGMLPASLTGASFNNKVLQLPDLKAAKILLSLVIKSFPEEFQEQDFTLDRVTGIATLLPTDLELVDPAGTVVWSFPGEYPDQNPPSEVDLRVNLEPALNTALKAGTPLDVTFRLRGTSAGHAGFSFAGATGALVREFPGVISTTLQGDPVQLALGDRLADEQPSSVVADLTVTYAGIRILETLSDTLPTGEPLSGVIVTDEPAARAFPPNAFASTSIARIGVIGRAPADCELSVQMVEMAGNSPGKALGAPGVLKLAASNTAQTQWVEIPPGIDLSKGNVGMTVRANQGRFFWASEGERPLVKIAVYDPNPAGRPLKLSGTQIMTVSQAEAIHVPARTFGGTLFRSQAPTFDSPLFLTVDLSDLTLRYAR